MSNKKKSRTELPASGLAEEILRQVAEEARAAGDRDTVYRFADRLPQPQVEVPKETRLETWTTFRLQGEIYALPVTHLREIVRVDSITRVPGGPREIRGVANVRGRVIPVVDLRARLGLAPDDLSARSRVLVAEARGRQVGLLVDDVRSVERIDLLAVEPPPQEVRTERSEFVLGVLRRERDLTILLEVEKVLLLEREPASAGFETKAQRGAPAASGEGGPGASSTGKDA